MDQLERQQLGDIPSLQQTIDQDRLVRAVCDLSLAQDLESIIEIVRFAARELTGADGATFILKEGSQCYYAEENAVSPLWKGKRFPVESCISGWAMLHRQTAVIEDIYQDPRIPHEAYRPTFVKSLVMVPIRTKSPIGAIGNYWAKQYLPQPYEVEILKSLADATSVAIENVQLIAHLKAAKEAAEMATQQKSQFLANITHELKTPLNAIIGYSEMLDGGLGGRPFNEKEKKYIQNVLTSSRHLLGLVNTLLDISRIDAGQFPVGYEGISLSSLVRTLMTLFSDVAAMKQVTLNFQVQPELELFYSDPKPLQQICSHLIENAIKFNRPQGRVDVSFSKSEDNAWWVCEVKDTGIGIPSHQLPDLFSDFHQVDASFARQYDGAGLGLSLTKRLVDLLEGILQVDSELNTGSTFTVRLPLKPRGTQAT